MLEPADPATRQDAGAISVLAADEAARLQGKVFAEIELEAAGESGGNAGRGAVLRAPPTITGTPAR